MNTEEFTLTPVAFRSLLPCKIAQTVDKIAQKYHISPLDAFRTFYRSRLYQTLENERTKCWWESPAELLRDYDEEMSRQ